MFSLASSTRALLQGDTWENKAPGLSDKQRLRKEVKHLRQKEYPCGTDWQGALADAILLYDSIVDISTGVQYELTERESKLPLEKRYIHSVVFQDDIKLAVTMLPRLAHHIHSAQYLAIDYTFKRVHGDTDEWEVATFLERYKKRELAPFKIHCKFF